MRTDSRNTLFHHFLLVMAVTIAISAFIRAVLASFCRANRAPLEQRAV